jgi:hypothetical protein
MGDLFQPMHLLVLFIVFSMIFPIKIIAYWQIFKKAGFEPALSILTVIPVVQLVLLYYVAFSDWKAGPANVPETLSPTLP